MTAVSMDCWIPLPEIYSNYLTTTEEQNMRTMTAAGILKSSMIGGAGMRTVTGRLGMMIRRTAGNPGNHALAALVITSLLASSPALAGDQGSEFDDVWNTLLGWAQGTLGKIIALSMMLVGIIAGVARQSIMAFAMGIAAGLGLFYAPGVINGVVSADMTSVQITGEASEMMIRMARDLGGH